MPPSDAPGALSADDGSRLHGAWHLLWIAFIAQATISFLELGVPVLAPFVKDDLALSAFEVGLVVTALNVGRLASALPSGQAADRLGERRVLVASGVGTAAFALLAAASGYWLLLLALAVAGLFAGASTPAGSKVVLRAFPRERRGLPMGVRQAAIPLGALAAAVALPPLADAFGWRSSLGVAAALPLVGAVAVVAATRARGWEGGVQARTALGPGDGEAAGIGALRAIAANRKIVLAGIWALLFVGGQYALLTYLVLYLDHDLGFSLDGAFAVLAVATAAGFAGRLAWGWLSDVAFGSRRRPGLMLAAIVGAAAALLLAAVPTGAPPAVAIAGAAVAGFCLIGWQGLWVTMVSELAPPDRSATAVGFALTFTTVGIVAWPPLLGLAADGAGSFRWSWLVLSLALVVSLIPLIAIGRVDRPPVVDPEALTDG